MKKSNWVGFLPFYLLVMILFIGIAGGSSELATVISQGSGTQRHAIIVDAGHGGVDGGATSCTGVLESQINLEIALRLNDLLHLLGCDTVMIRTTDTSVYTEGTTIAAKKVSDLKERVRIVNGTENAVLVSIHQNTFSDSRYSGAQVFYGGANNSRDLARALQSAFSQSVNPGSSRKCKKADSVYLMQNISCTGILVECGFLSNPREEALLRSPEYQQKLCCVIGSALTVFLEKNG